MRKMLLWAPLIFYILAAGCDGNISSSEQNEASALAKQSALTLTIGLDRAAYQKATPILITVKLTNVGDSSIIINNRMLPGYTTEEKRKIDKKSTLRYYIYSPSGGEVRFELRYEAPLVGPKDFISLAPKDSFQINFDLRKGFVFPDESGHYTIYVVYYNYFDPSWFSKAWKGELKSNVVNFEIKP